MNSSLSKQQSLARVTTDQTVDLLVFREAWCVTSNSESLGVEEQISSEASCNQHMFITHGYYITSPVTGWQFGCFLSLTRSC